MALKLDLADRLSIDEVTRVGAVDISFFPHDDRAISALVVMENGVVVYEDYEDVTFDVPYMAGFLGFREVPCYTRLYRQMMAKHPEVEPHIVLVDGNGILHHRMAGSATQLGMELDICTVGIAKN